MPRRSVRGRRLWLTPALRRQAERLRQEWLTYAMATTPVDRPAGEEARIPTPGGDEDLVVVDVLNATPEPDGTRRRYVLRVPPDQRVPRDAIGWTFGLPPGVYHPTEMT